MTFTLLNRYFTAPASPQGHVRRRQELDRGPAGEHAAEGLFGVAERLGWRRTGGGTARGEVRVAEFRGVRALQRGRPPPGTLPPHDRHRDRREAAETKVAIQ